jgi:hypothetical protein
MAGEARPDAQLFQLLSDLLQQVRSSRSAVDLSPAVGQIRRPL